MAGTPTSFPDGKFTRGINGLSPINELDEGFIEDCVNVSPSQAGELISREGTRTRAGLIPLRVGKVTYSTSAEDNITVQVLGGPNFAPLSSRPLLIRGRMSSAGNTANAGDFPNNEITSKIFDHFRVITAVEVAGNGTQVFPETSLTIPGCVRRTSFADRSALAAVAIQSYSIDSGTLDGTLTLDGDPAVLYSAWTLPAAIEVGRCYHHTATLTQSQNVQTVSIPSTTHGVVGVDYIVRAFHNTGTSFDLIDIDEVHIANNGNVSVLLRQNFAASANLVIVILRAESLLNGTLTLGATSTLGPLSGAGTPYLIYSCYYADSGTWKECRPDSLEYDAVTDEVTVEFNNLNGIPATSVKVCLLKFGAAADTFVVTGTQIGIGFTDYLPEMCIYGIDAAELGESYAPSRLVDAYRDQASETPVTVQLLTPFMESSLPSASSTVALSVLVDTQGSPTTQLGPVFSTEVWRTRGSIVTPDAGTSGLVGNPSVVVVGVNLEVTVPLSVYASHGNPFGANDYLTLQRMFRPELNGVHPISSIVLNPSSIVFTIPNPAPLLGNLIQGNGGQAGVFTNYFSTFAGVTCPFLLGDVLTAVNNTTDFGTFSGYESGELMCELAKNVSLPYNQTVIARRVASVIPLTTSFLVQGDSVIVDGEYRQVLGSHVGIDLDVVTITGIGGQASAVVAGEYYHTFNRGRKFLLLQAGEFTGEQTCTNVMWDGGNTTIFFDHPATGTHSGGHIAGSSIEVAPIEVEASVNVSLPVRWEALEGLRDSSVGTRGPDDRPACFTADEPLVSAGFGGMLYTCSQNNYPIAIDPFGWRTTGMPDWDPWISAEPTLRAGGIGIEDKSIDFIDLNGFVFKLALGASKAFVVGEQYVALRGPTYEERVCVVQVTDIPADDASYSYVRASVISGASAPAFSVGGKLRKVAKFRYGAQLRYIDYANNIVLGPMCGLSDVLVTLDGAYAVSLVLVEPPHVGYVDYTRGVFIDLYRTHALYNEKITSADDPQLNTYYKLASIACTFSGLPYIAFLDTLPDSLLLDLDSDTRTATDSWGVGVSKSLLLPPPRCKTLSSISGYMVYGNLTGRPRVELQFLADQTLTYSSLQEGTVQVGANVFEFTSSTGAITNLVKTGTTISAQIISGYPIATGDWLYIDMELPTSAAYGGTYSDRPGYVASGLVRVTNRSGDNITFSMPGADGTQVSHLGNNGQAYYASVSGRIPVPTRATTNEEVTWPVSAVAMRNLSKIMNVYATMTTNPMFYARAGTPIGAGQINIFSADPAQLISVALPTAVRLSVNGEYKVQTATNVSFEEQIFPSRLALSGKGYAEVCGAYDYPANKAMTAIVDVNPADGDEIVAIRPLLADSLFSDTQLQQVLVVFKRRSVHAVDILKRVNGASDYCQQIVSYGVGCCSPTAVAHTEHGIVFAGRDSIYLLNKSLELSRIGELVERHLEEQAYPADDTVACRGGEKAYISWGSDVFVAKPYPQTEQWSRWELPRKVFGWASVDSRALAGCQGRMLEFRTNLSRDDSVTFTSQVTLKAQDFGDPSILKELNEIAVDTNVRNIVVEFATEMRTNWMPCSLVKPKPEFADDALTETYRSRRSVLRFACPAKKFQTLQIRITLLGDVSEAVATLDSGADSEVLEAAKALLQVWIQRHGSAGVVPTQEQLTREARLKLSRVIYKVRGWREKGTAEAAD